MDDTVGDTSIDKICFIKEYCDKRGMLLATLNTKKRNDFAVQIAFDAYEKQRKYKCL